MAWVQVVPHLHLLPQHQLLLQLQLLPQQVPAVVARLTGEPK